MKFFKKVYFYKALGWYQVFGAFYGIYALFSSFDFVNLFISLAFIVLLFVSGFWLLFDLSYKSYKLAVCNQMIQTIQFNLFGYGFSFAAGLYLAIASDTWSLEQVYLDMRSWTFIIYLLLNSSENQFHLAINFMPMLILLLMNLFKGAIFQNAPIEDVRRV